MTLEPVDPGLPCPIDPKGDGLEIQRATARCAAVVGVSHERKTERRKHHPDLVIPPGIEPNERMRAGRVILCGSDSEHLEA